MPQAPDLIGAAVACEVLDIDRSTLSRWVQIGKLTPAMRLGERGAFLFHPDEVERRRVQYAAEKAERAGAA